ncbi:MAG: hypothetical protein PHR35_23090, partial [Kiritimatiellae bacterium]|nr:hypothetical protein [Kiritimatiellia bacterium]
MTNTHRCCAIMWLALGFACYQPAHGQAVQHAYYSGRPGFQYVRQMQSVGVTNLQTWVKLADLWVGSNRFDFAATDGRLRAALADLPGGRLMLRVAIYTPAWWLNDHTDQALLAPAGTVTWRASLASRLWRKATAEAMASWLRHLDEIGLLDAIVDIQLDAGPVGENAYSWGNAQPQRVLFDYSAPMRARLLELTGGDMPSVEERLAASDLDIRDPVAMGDVIACQSLLSQAMAESLTEVAAAVKNATHGRVSVGAFYGYLFLPGWRPWEHHTTGHLALETLLASPDVDTIAAPYGYMERGPGGVFCGQQPLDSIRAAGKQ